MRWAIDPSHTSLDFAVRHLGISTVRGRFAKVSGTVETAEGSIPTSIQAAIDASSIDTGVTQRDDHLRSPDFLDARNYSQITFRSTSITPLAADTYRVDGELTIRGEVRPITFEVETAAPVTDPWGNLRAGASAQGKLNRRDWGLTWNQILEFGALAVGEDIKFTLDVEMVAEVPAAVR
jgi:polyisoprenoid-binding protein YceI